MDDVAPEQVQGSSKEVYSDYSWTLDPATNKKTQCLELDARMVANRQRLLEGPGFGNTGDPPPAGTCPIKGFARLSIEAAAKFQQPIVRVLDLLPQLQCKHVGPETMGTGVPRPPRIVSGGGPNGINKAMLGRQAYLVRDLLDKGYAPRPTCGGIPDMWASVLITKDGRVAAPFEILSADDLPMKVSNRANPSCNPKAPHLLLLTYCYKNDAYIVDLHYALSRDMSQLGKTRTVLESVEFLSQKEALRKRFRSLPLLPFGFSGGSQTISGARGFSVNSSSHDDPHYRTLYKQVALCRLRKMPL